MPRTVVHASVDSGSIRDVVEACCHACPGGCDCSLCSSEAVRLRDGQMLLLTWFTLKMSSEDENAHFIVSPISLAAGVILSLALFPTRIAYASIGVVAVGDPAASCVGERFGRVRGGQKTLAGSAAGFPAESAVSSLWGDPTLSLVGLLMGMLLELLVRFDHNLIMTIGAGLAIFAGSIL